MKNKLIGILQIFVCFLALTQVLNAQCTNDCEIELGSSDPYVSFSGDITNDVTGNEMFSQAVDVLDGSTTCGFATDGTNDYTFTFITEEYFDVYGGNTIASGAGSSTRDITQSSSGIRGNNITGTNSSTTNTSTGDVSCYSLSVCFAVPQQAQNVNVNLTSVNTAGESFESTSVVFYDAACSPYGTATYNGFWAGTPQGSNGGTNTTAVNPSSSIYTTTGTGVYIASDISIIDVATDPMNPVATTSTTSNDYDPNASTDGGLAATALVGGFIVRVCLEDVAITANDDESTTSSTAFTSTINGFDICLDQCPDGLADATAPAVTVTSESTCETDGTTLSGGVIAAPTATCPTGSSLEYSIDGTTWSATIPTYNQTTGETISTRCTCASDPTVFSATSMVTTAPGMCPAPCPNLTFTSLSVECHNSNTIQYSYVFENNGLSTTSLSTSTGVVIQAYLSADPVYSAGTDLPAGGFVLGAGTGAALDPGQDWCGNFTAGGGASSSIVVDPVATPFLILIIDSNDNLTECDESDNIIYAKLPQLPCDFVSAIGFAASCTNCIDHSPIPKFYFIWRDDSSAYD